MVSQRAKKLKRTALSETVELLALARKKKDVISFGGGAPSLLPDEELLEKVKEISSDVGVFRYSSFKGEDELRELISDELRDYGIERDADEIIVVEGSTMGLFLAMASLVDAGDKVGLLDPTYMGYKPLLDFFNAKPVWIRTTQDFQPDLEDLKEKIKGLKALIFLSPDNPTGRIISRRNCKAIAEICEDSGVWIVTDEAYREIVYEGEVTLPSQYYEGVLGVYSYSKSASIPGMRVGYIYGPKEQIDFIEGIKGVVTLTGNPLAQKVAAAFYSVKEKYLRERVIPTYRRKRDVMEKALESYGFKFFHPSGAFYIFVDVRNHGDDVKLSKNLLEHGVVTLPGSFFGPKGEGWLRLTFVSESEERIEEGIRRIAQALGM